MYQGPIPIGLASSYCSTRGLRRLARRNEDIVRGVCRILVVVAQAVIRGVDLRLDLDSAQVDVVLRPVGPEPVLHPGLQRRRQHVWEHSRLED